MTHIHPELSGPDKLVQTIYLNIPVETAWRQLTDPVELTRWMAGPMGGQLQRIESGRSLGGRFNCYGKNGTSSWQQVGKILGWEPPYQFMYAYWHPLSNLPELPGNQVTLVFQLTALPQNRSMLSLTQTGFPKPFTFEQADIYWRDALARLRRLHAVEAS